MLRDSSLSFFVTSRGTLGFFSSCEIVFISFAKRSRCCWRLIHGGRVSISLHKLANRDNGGKFEQVYCFR